RVHLELKLTSSDYLVKDEQENKEITHKQQELINQLSRLKNDKKIDEIERAELEQSLLEQAEEYKKQLQELKTKHKKEIQNYRLFNSLEREDEGNKKYKRKTLDYGMLSRYSSIYSDHNRASSMTSFPQSPTLDFEIALKTPKTAKSLQEELSGAIFNESEKSLDTTLNNLMGEINQVIEISPETVKELEDRILNLTQQQEAYQQHIQQQEVMVQELAQKNILLQEQLATEQDQTKRVRNMEQSLLILNQNNLGLAVEKDNLQEQLRQKDYQLQSSELKQANYYNFIKSLAEIFPLSETQQEKLNETDEPDKKFLSLLKTNIFGGVNKLREQITNSRTEIIEVEKQRQQLLNEVEELKKEKKSLEESMDLTELQEVVAELDELENYIEINNLLKNGKYNLMNKLEEAHKELETMEKERDELQTKNTELQDELDNVKASREKGDDEIAGFIADANREMEELDAKIEQATNY
ncbi:332_t:CDS:2, partial [Racocetra persica]